ncbi:unnamed protein product [Tetraodon nigroviridis]|uniref:(spotted green pufferfish) hypothetical protein n=1 Tax=Tetraodon nigroviridis TaxID=99883 RepID=Q4RPS9_TETNG|nr:unnamed protein product [Tetraodon nigroviridis]
MSATLFNETDFGNSEHNNTCFPVGDDRWKWFWVRCESRLGPKKSVDKYQPVGVRGGKKKRKEKCKQPQRLPKWGGSSVRCLHLSALA